MNRSAIRALRLRLVSANTNAALGVAALAAVVFVVSRCGERARHSCARRGGGDVSARRNCIVIEYDAAGTFGELPGHYSARRDLDALGRKRCSRRLNDRAFSRIHRRRYRRCSVCCYYDATCHSRMSRALIIERARRCERAAYLRAGVTVRNVATRWLQSTECDIVRGA